MLGFVIWLVCGVIALVFLILAVNEGRQKPPLLKIYDDDHLRLMAARVKRARDWERTMLLADEMARAAARERRGHG